MSRKIKFEPLPKKLGRIIEDAEYIELKPSGPLDLSEFYSKKWFDIFEEHPDKNDTQFWTKERRAEYYKDMVEMKKWKKKYGNKYKNRKDIVEMKKWSKEYENKKIKKQKGKKDEIIPTAIVSEDDFAQALAEVKEEKKVARRNGGKKRILSGPKKIRKHSGIHQTGGKAGKLKKGYKYSGKKLKNGKAEIKKVKSKNKK